MYMFHGGSSFGFMTGAVSDPSYRALVSSYAFFSKRRQPPRHANLRLVLHWKLFVTQWQVFVDRRYIGLFKHQNHELAVPDGKVIAFEEQKGDYNVHIEDSPDLDMAAEIQ